MLPKPCVLSLALLLAAAVAALPAAGPPPAGPAAVHVEVASGRIDFRFGKALAGRYVIDAKVAKPYFWPLNAPNGEPITRGWPMIAEPGSQTDHVHQKSAWFCHGDVIPEGIELKHKIRGVEGVDFWSEAKGHGKIVCTKAGDVLQDKNHGRVVTHNEWRTADDVKIMDEKRTIHFYNFGDAQLFVLDIDLCASVVPITFGDTKEGSLGVRVRTDLTEAKGKGKLTNAEGKTGEGKGSNRDKTGCWGLVSKWCDYSGPVGRTAAGITVFADPSNPYATAWHARGYGLLAANPFGRARSGFPAMKGNKELVKLAKGDHLKLRYGIFLHSGDVKEGKVTDYYDRFVALKKSEG
jgi:hypothetical protein